MPVMSSYVLLLLLLSLFSHVWLCVTLWTAAHRAPLSIGFSRQEYWSGLLFPSPGDIVFNLIYFNWRIITLQYCDGFAIHQHRSAIGIHVSPSSWTPLLLLSSPHPSRLSQSTDFGYPESYLRLPLAVCFTYGNICVSMLLFLFNTHSTWASIWEDIKWLMIDFFFNL